MIIINQFHEKNSKQGRRGPDNARVRSGVGRDHLDKGIRKSIFEEMIFQQG
jgi:hypothetical protein